MQTEGSYEAKTKLASILDRVDRGESFTITRHGKPVAVLMKPMDSPFPDAKKAIEEIKNFRQKFASAFEGLNVAEMIQENRRELDKRWE